jgi:hypothetical protein
VSHLIGQQEPRCVNFSRSRLGPAERLCARCGKPEGEGLMAFIVSGEVSWHEGCAADAQWEHDRDHEAGSW